MSEVLQTTCCVAGGGPAGVMLGLLLARAGVDVIVLEKHADFFRDFRGDTVHPSTLDVLSELGLLDEFLKRPHQEAKQLTGIVGGVPVPVADFTHVTGRARCVFLEENRLGGIDSLGNKGVWLSWPAPLPVPEIERV